MPDPRFATSLANGWALLDTFADAPDGLTNKQMAERTGLSKASVSRLCTTLVARGLLEVDARRHRLGSSALTLGYPLLASLGIRRVARLPMHELAQALGATVSLAMRDRHRMVYVETCRANLPLAFRPDVGAVLSMLRTAAGRAWLSSAGPAERDATWHTLRENDATCDHWEPALAQAAQDFEHTGCCFSLGDWQADVHALAVPLQVSLAGERLVLNCGMPAHGLRPGELADRIAPQLLALARRIERDWLAEPASPSPWPLLPQAAAAGPRTPPEGSASQTLSRGLDLLQCFAPTDTTLGNAELARRLGVSPQTMVRLCFTLTQLGLLRKDPTRRGYRLGARVLTIAHPMLAGLRLRALARPAMHALSQRFAAAVSLGVRHQLGMVYVDTAWRTDDRLLPPDTGAVMPMLATAMGRAWLCSAPHDERRAVMNQMAVHTPEHAQRFSGALAQAARQFARHGHCSSRDFRPEIEAVAVPFARPVDGMRFVLNCGVLAPQPLAAHEVHALGMALSDVVKQLEAQLHGD